MNLSRPPHTWPVRLCHWLNVYAVGCLIGSGLGIYNAYPLLQFSFPAWSTLGGWLGGSIAWHLSAIWLLLANGMCYVLYGIFSGHFKRDFLPVSRADVWRDLKRALKFSLKHETGHYNAVQRLMYWSALLLSLLLVLSGLAIWKPVQLQWLTSLFGGFQGARWIHFTAMLGLITFIVIHLLLVTIVPRTLLPMITGRKCLSKKRGDDESN